MNSAFKKISFLLLSMGFLISCNAVKVVESSKQITHPGVPSGTSSISYSLQLNTSEEIKIESVSLLQLSLNTPITQFSITDLSDGKILKPEATLKKGSYWIGFSVGTTVMNGSDSIQIEYTASGKLKTIMVVPELKADLHMK